MNGKYLNPAFENSLLSEGKFDYIVGIDEVGRGSWAGPVGVGAYIYSKNSSSYSGVNDSKLLTSIQKDKLYKYLSKDNYLVKFGEVSEIDNFGIGKTITRIILDLVNEIKAKNPRTFFLIDGQFAMDFGENTKKVIKGDSQFYCIAAASIVAKVESDRFMKSIDSKYPNYHFITNVGYPSKKHREALNIYGPSEIHRVSYKPIKILIEGFTTD